MPIQPLRTGQEKHATAFAMRRHAGIHDALQQAAAQSHQLGRQWMLAKDFAINRRYPDGASFPVRLGRDMVAAAGGKDGLVEWLNRPVT